MDCDKSEKMDCDKEKELWQRRFEDEDEKAIGVLVDGWCDVYKCRLCWL